ncbi:MAG: RraA family protein [Candidatus Puniceispirillum sp.]|nr:RraA family protein [Candidatus Puniceispirillum sp.]MBL6774807.1 RraA family protein [Candidatus Puniceispirillum sp.]
MSAAITANDLAVLMQWDTPTICNALEEIVPERRGYGFTTTHLFSLDPDLPPICGFARTATIRAAAPSDESAAEMAAKRAAYYEYVATAPSPTIVVIQDIDPQPGIGAFWGEVQTNIHKGLGVLGAVTNGSFRDVPDSARGFNLIGGKVGPSHAFVHLVDIDCQVTVHGLTANTNDIIHADQHGAVLIPPSAVRQIPATIDLISRREAIILETAKSPNFTVEKLKTAMGQMQDIH